MLLLNTSQFEIETKFDGKVHTFAPFENKRINDGIEGSHVLFKLSMYGVIELPDTREYEEAKLGDKILEEHLVKGMRSYRKTLNGVVMNYRTMNKEREAAKLSAEQPNDNIIESVKRIKAIDQELANLKADDYKLVEDYLGKGSTKQAEGDIKKLDRNVNEDGKLTGEANLAKKNGKPEKEKGSSTGRRRSRQTAKV